jgi:hypothetical protein
MNNTKSYNTFFSNVNATNNTKYNTSNCNGCPYSQECSKKQIEELAYLDDLDMVLISRYWNKPEGEFLYTVTIHADEVLKDENGKNYLALYHTGLHNPKKAIIVMLSLDDCNRLPNYAICWGVTTRAQELTQEDLDRIQD